MTGAAKDILLMTSTIAPKAGTFALKRADPAERLQDYLLAFRFYARALRDGVFRVLVYVDNSGADLAPLARIAEEVGVAGSVEFVSYSAGGSGAFSRFYLEARLLVEAMARSRILAEAGDAAIWKVTGRYVVENVAALVRTQPERFDIYINLRNRPERVADFFLLAFRRDAFDAFLGRDVEGYRTTEAGETILRRKIDAGKFARLRIVPRLARTPRVAGIRGWDGASYRGLSHQVKYRLRAAANRLIPWLWI